MSERKLAAPVQRLVLPSLHSHVGINSFREMIID